MKLMYVLLLAGMSLMTLVNCNKNTAANTSASPDMSASCLYGGCNTNAYYSSNGFTPAQNYGYAANNGINCQMGYPVYSASKGAGCANIQSSNQVYYNGTPVVYVLNPSTGTFQAFNGYSSGLYSNVQAYRACDTGDQCPSDQSCRSPFGPYNQGSSIGICYRN